MLHIFRNSNAVKKLMAPTYQRNIGDLFIFP